MVIFLAFTCTQVAIEERQLLKLLRSNSNSEVEEAQQEIVQLQNELKVRTKLNKLQSSKVQCMVVYRLIWYGVIDVT